MSGKIKEGDRVRTTGENLTYVTLKPGWEGTVTRVWRNREGKLIGYPYDVQFDDYPDILAMGKKEVEVIK